MVHRDHRLMQNPSDSAPGWDGRERRSHNPWIDVLMSSQNELKEGMQRQTEILEDMDRRLVALEAMKPELQQMASVWAGAGLISKILFAFAAGVLSIWGVVELMKGHK